MGEIKKYVFMNNYDLKEDESMAAFTVFFLQNIKLLGMHQFDVLELPCEFGLFFLIDLFLFW